MRARPAAVSAAVALILAAGSAGCSSATNVADLQVGDCLSLGGTADRPHAAEAECGSRESNFKVVATAAGSEQCPVDVDSSYSMRSAFNRSGNTVCLDIDWVVGGCMSVDPQNNTDPVRVDCNDTSVRPRQRATQILRGTTDPVSADECASGLGYTYTERRFTVCVENVG